MGISRRFIGLMSGTSCDGVDGALVDIEGQGTDMRVRCLNHCSIGYSERLRHALLQAMAPARTRTETLAMLNMEVGQAFAKCARDLMAKTRSRPADITAIGSHGQTLCHMPDSREQPATLQIGEPAVIAAKTGVMVVADFRQADLAVGGQGAPLVPWTDFVLFRSAAQVTCVQNIGGIANVTCVSPETPPSGVVAFDTGPGCMVIDELIRRRTKKKRHYDPEGQFAAKGRPDSESVERVMQLPFFLKAPPKSAGREEFGHGFVNGMVQLMVNAGLDTYDMLATATMLTARSIATSYHKFLEVRQGAQMVLCGGGTQNTTLVNMLRRELPEVSIRTIDDFGMSTKAKECVSFAMLAAAALDGVPANLPQVTGASRPAILGKIVRV